MPLLVPLLSVMLLLSWCGEAETLTTHACEGNLIKIWCPVHTNQVILVRSAMYGRRSDPTSRGRCGSNQVLHRQCEADITPYVKFRCENKHMCEVIVDVATFGLEMCVDVMKYAEVNYDCVQPHSMNSIKGCLSTCANPGHSVHHAAARKHLGRSKTQIPGPGLGKSLGFRHPPAPASAIASPFAGASNSGAGFSRASAAVPSPPRASYASSSSKPAAKSPPSAGPSAPALPYGTLSRSMAAALTNGSGSRFSAPAVGAMRSATARAALMNRLQRVMMALRNRGRQG